MSQLAQIDKLAFDFPTAATMPGQISIVWLSEEYGNSVYLLLPSRFGYFVPFVPLRSSLFTSPNFHVLFCPLVLKYSKDYVLAIPSICAPTVAFRTESFHCFPLFFSHFSLACRWPYSTLIRLHPPTKYRKATYLDSGPLPSVASPCRYCSTLSPDTCCATLHQYSHSCHIPPFQRRETALKTIEPSVHRRYMAWQLALFVCTSMHMY